jgi:hypothetical protein
MQQTHARKMGLQRFDQRFREQGDAILEPLAVAHEDSPVIEIDIFDTKAQGLEESQPTSVKQSGDQCMLSIEVGDDPLSILLPQHGW